jgi:16S rRNA (uracil1498-N3)-methyltransferase
MPGVRARFYLPEIDANGCGVLGEDEAGHLTRVLRLVTGAEIAVFDGRGGMFQARVEAITRDAVRVRVTGPAPSAAEAAVRVTLVASVLKGDTVDEVVRDAVMMGVAGIQPVVAHRSEVSVATLARGHRLDRWRRIAVSSVKQCGRAVLPPVHAPLDLHDWLTHRGREAALVLTEPAAGGGARLREIPRSDRVDLVVGPEGGWTAEESAAFAAAGFRAVSLGRRTLRADAAPLVAMAALFEAWDGW